MLKQRVLTALALLPPVLAAVWFVPAPWLSLALGLVVLVAAQEWAVLSGCATRGRQAAFVAACAPLVAVLVVMNGHPAAQAVLVASLAWWLWMLRWIAIYPRGFEGTFPPPALRVAAGLLVIPAALCAVAQLHADHPARLLYLLFLVWAADVGAYFAGKSLGRRKLAPRVSPGKTVEGLLGGLALAAVIAAAGGLWVFDVRGLQWLVLLALSLGVVLLSVVGDLAESLLKRRAGVKDSGALLPGHGGLLDRVDSLLAAAPAFALGLAWTGL